MSECQAPDCDKPPSSMMRRYCSAVCYNVALKAAWRAQERSVEEHEPVSMEDLPDEEVTEIREATEEAHEKLQEQLREAAGGGNRG